MQELIRGLYRSSTWTPSSAETRQFAAGGRTRTYLLHRPASAPEHPALLVVLHGATMTAEWMRELTRFDDVADAEGFVVVYPQGVGNTWNAGPCCGEAHELGIDDTAFLRGLIEHLVVTEGVDPGAVYATGLSNGAYMAYGLATNASDSVAAIGVVSAYPMVPERLSRPLSVLHIHGTADPIVPFEGNAVLPPSRPEIARWAAVNGCPSRPSRDVDGSIARDTWTCAGASVELWLVRGMAHSWPAPDSGDPGARALDASRVIWDFFATHGAESAAR